MKKVVFERIVEAEVIDTEDSGQAMIIHVESDGEPRLFVKLQSWDEDCKHPELKDIVGKRVKITVEIEDE